MKYIKYLFAKLGLLVLLGIGIQCATSQKIDKVAPVKIEGAYYQDWMSGVREGGHGFMVYVPVEENSAVQLNFIYFKGKKIELELNSDKVMYEGRYTYPSEKRDLIMSNDPKKEFRNPVPEMEVKIPFDLKDEECIFNYTKKGRKGYFKLDKLPEKEMKHYPMEMR